MSSVLLRRLLPPSRLAYAVPFLLAAAPLSTAQGPIPQAPEFRRFVPSNTGIPGHNNVLFVSAAPDGRVWTGARDAFWQQGGVAALDRSTGLWETYSNVETSLPQWCYAIAHAPDGSAWVAGDDVVSRVRDGIVTSYGTETGVLIGGPYTSITVDGRGHVWAANSGSVGFNGGLFEFDGTRWVRHTEPWMMSGSVAAAGLAVFARANGEVWTSFSLANGMGRWADGTWTQISGAPVLLRFAEGPDGTFYGVNGNGQWRLDEATVTWRRFGTFPASELAVDPNDGWLYCEDGFDRVQRYDGTGFEVFADPPGQVQGISVAENGDVWIAAEFTAQVECLFHHDASGTLLRGYNSINTGVPDYLLDRVQVDDLGRIWFVSGEFGGSRLDPGEDYRNFGTRNLGEEVYPFLLPGGPLYEGLAGIFPDSKGNTWLLANGVAKSAGEDLSRWDLYYYRNSILPSGLLEHMGEAPNGDIFVGGDFTTYRFDGTSWEAVPVGGGGGFAEHGLHNGADGQLYAFRITTVYRWKDDAWVPLASTPCGARIRGLAVAVDGTLWVATSCGVQRYDGTGWTTFDSSNTPMNADHVADVEIRDDGLVAAVYFDIIRTPYRGGVALYDGSSWTAFHHGQSGLPFYQNDGLAFDREGDLWMAAVNYGGVEMKLGAAARCQPDLGGRTPGGPDLAVCGAELRPGQSSRAALTGAAPLAPVAVLWSVSSAPLPFAGGTIVPWPPAAVLPASTDATGELRFPVPAPAVPVQVYVQSAVAEPAGVALSNALLLDALF